MERCTLNTGVVEAIVATIYRVPGRPALFQLSQVPSAMVLKPWRRNEKRNSPCERRIAVPFHVAYSRKSGWVQRNSIVSHKPAIKSSVRLTMTCGRPIGSGQIYPCSTGSRLSAIMVDTVVGTISNTTSHCLPLTWNLKIFVSCSTSPSKVNHYILLSFM